MVANEAVDFRLDHCEDGVEVVLQLLQIAHLCCTKSAFGVVHVILPELPANDGGSQFSLYNTDVCLGPFALRHHCVEGGHGGHGGYVGHS